MFPEDIFTERVVWDYLTGIIPKSTTWSYGKITKVIFSDGLGLLRTKMCSGGDGFGRVSSSSPLETASKNFSKTFQGMSILHGIHKAH